MKRPLPPGAAINGQRYKRWIDCFGAYRSQVTTSTIESWLHQFKRADRDLAARVLDAVEFYGQSQIHAAYKQALASLPGWNKEPAQRQGKWRFAAMSSSAGESGDRMLHEFRLANGLDFKKYNELFVSRSELLRQGLGADDTVVLLDDFSGTGTQVCDAWSDPAISYGEILAGVGTVFLILIAASRAARNKIAADTRIRLLSAHELHEGDNVFSDKCKHFTGEDRERLLHYGKMADNRNPRGFGDCGFLVIFQHRSPNNSIPILHADHDKWCGLFPRHD